MNGKRQTKRPIANRTLMELRINAGLSVNDLAYRAQVSPGSVRLAERGFAPGPRIQFAVADVFGLRPLDIWPLTAQKDAVVA